MAIRKSLKRLVHRGDRGFVWDNLARASVVLTLVLVPVFALPISGDLWEIHKAAVLLTLVSLGWITTLIGAIRRGKHQWQWHSLDWFMIAVGGGSLLSLAFAVDAWVGLTGLSGALSDTTSVVLGLIGLAWLIRLHFREQRLQVMIWIGLGAGIGLGLIHQIFQLSGVPLLANSFPDTPLFSVFSSNPTDNALIAALFGPGVLLFWSQARESWQRWMIIAAVSLSWLVVLFLQQSLAWAVFALGMIGVVLVQSRRGSRANVKLISAAVILAGLGMLAQFTGLAERSSIQTPLDLRLDQSTTQGTTSRTLAARPVLGTGPNSWYHAFVQYRPVEYNEQAIWSTRFIKARSAWWQITATTGIVGLVSWAGLFLAGMWYLWRRWSKQADPVVLAGMLVLSATLITGFFVTWSFVWMLLVWTVLGMALLWSSAGPKKQSVGSGTWVALSLIALGLVALGYPAGRMYASQVATDGAQRLIVQGASLEVIQTKLEKAARLDSRNLDAADLLAQIHASQSLQAAQLGQVEEANRELRFAVDSLQPAVALLAANPAALEAMNNLLNRLSPLASDAEVEARKNFERLRRLEPTNPIHEVGYGQTLLISRTKLLGGQTPAEQAQAQADQMLQEALAAFGAALDKKADYFQAETAYAQALSESGESEAAVSFLLSRPAASQENGRYWLTLGQIYAQLDQSEPAEAAFTRTLTVDPFDTAAYLTVADYYQTGGNTDQARATIDQGLTNLPDQPDLVAARDALATE